MTTAASSLLGRPVWYELMTTDTGAAETFYKNVVGWTAAPFEGSPDPYHLQARRRPRRRWSDEETGRHEHAAVLGDVCRRAEVRGCRGAHQAPRGERGPMEVPGGDWVVNAMDPQGAAFSLHAKKAQ